MIVKPSRKPTIGESTMNTAIVWSPEPISEPHPVLATCVPKTRNATKLKKAAHATASRGVSTLVETTVAMEFAASWNPLKKSNASATPTMRTSATFMPSGVLQDDRLDRVRDVLASVDRLLHLVQDVLPLQDLHRAVLA